MHENGKRERKLRELRELRLSWYFNCSRLHNSIFRVESEIFEVSSRNTEYVLARKNEIDPTVLFSMLPAAQSSTSFTHELFNTQLVMTIAI